MSIPKNIAKADRSKIAIDHPEDVKYWTRHLGITEAELRDAIERVGNSAAAVRKQLGMADDPVRKAGGK